MTSPPTNGRLAEESSPAWSRSQLGASLSWLIPLAVFALLFATFSAVASNFCTVGSVLTLLMRTSIFAVLGIGSLVVLMVGAVDLSVGAVMALSGVYICVFITRGAPIWLAMILGAAMGGGVGLVNGLLVARLRLPSFLSTLAMGIVIYGALGFIFLNPRGGVPAPPPTLPASLGDLASSHVLRIVARDASGADVVVFPGISWIVVIAAVVAVLSHLVLTRTRLGRLLVLVGVNPEAARYSGVRVVRVKTTAFVCSGLLAGLAAVLLTSLLRMPPVGLSGYEFIAIECAVIGGASLSGGCGRVMGTIVGCFILSTLDMGLTMTNADHLYLPILLNGLILLATVALDQWRSANGTAFSPPLTGSKRADLPMA
jgi:ribose transport system permease protein